MSLYSSHFTPNHSDDEGRYHLENQGRIGLWNLDKLGRALKPLLTTTESQKSLEVILSGYSRRYQEQRLQLFRQKLGLGGDQPQPGSQILIDSTITEMANNANVMFQIRIQLDL